MRFNDAVFGVLLIVFALAEMAYTRTFPSLHGQTYGPNLFPILIGLGLIICGVALVVRGVAARHTHAWVSLGEWADQRKNVVDVAVVLVALVLYISLSGWIGFIPLSVLILSVLLYRLGSSLVLSLALALFVTLLIQLLFARVLLVPLPDGLLRSVLW